MVVGLDDVRTELVPTNAAAARSRVSVAGLLARAAMVFTLAACAQPDTERGAGNVAGADVIAGTDSLARARQDSINRSQPGYVVDSILPVADELGRFRTAVGGTAVTRLEHASPSRAALIQEVRDALAASDARRLGALTLTAREFADLVYPESPYTQPPMRQAAGLVWAQISNASNSGFTRLITRVGGLELRIENHRCDKAPEQLGRNRIWAGCAVHLTDARGRSEWHRLFGSIIERDGRFKIISWAGEF